MGGRGRCHTRREIVNGMRGIGMIYSKRMSFTGIYHQAGHAEAADGAATVPGATRVRLRLARRRRKRIPHPGGVHRGLRYVVSHKTDTDSAKSPEMFQLRRISGKHIHSEVRVRWQVICMLR